MKTHLDIMRAINARATRFTPYHRIDDDLAREAGVNVTYAFRLQAARDLDNAASGAFECTNPRYCATRERFDTVEEFLDMCSHAFGVAPLLTARNCGDEYHDEHGEVALRAVWS